MRRRMIHILLLALVLLVLLPLLASGAGVATSEHKHWSQTRWDSAGLAPDPASLQDAVIQVYAARLWGWRGAVAVHSWIVIKPANGNGYTR